MVKNDGSGCLRYDLDVQIKFGHVITEGQGAGGELRAQHVVHASFPSKFAGGIGALRVFRCPDRATAHPLTLPDVFLFEPGYGVVITVGSPGSSGEMSPTAGPCVLPEITPNETIPMATKSVLTAGCPISPDYQPVLTAAQRHAGLEYTLGGYAQQEPVSPPCCITVTPPIANILPEYFRGGDVYLVNTLTAAHLQ